MLWPTERGQQSTKSFANARRFGLRRARDPVETQGSGHCKIGDSLEGHVVRHFDNGVPVAEDFQERDLWIPEPLVSAFRTGSAADESHVARVARRATGYCDRLSARHLRRQTERQPCAPRGGADTVVIDELVNEAVWRRRGHSKARRRSAPVEPSPNSTEFSLGGQARQGLRHRFGRPSEVLGAPESITRPQDHRADLGRNTLVVHA